LGIELYGSISIFYQILINLPFFLAISKNNEYNGNESVAYKTLRITPNIRICALIVLVDKSILTDSKTHVYGMNLQISWRNPG
jgi:hypothetical protein